jgi:hypothetical protein
MLSKTVFILIFHFLLHNTPNKNMPIIEISLILHPDFVIL